MTMKQLVDRAVDERFSDKGRASRIVLTPRGMREFISELRPVLPFHVEFGPALCPHCGKSLVQYRGLAVEEMGDRDVFVE